MNQSPPSCFQCGATIKLTTNRNNPSHCEYCGAPLTQITSSVQAFIPTQPTVQPTSNTGFTQSEIASLKRPKPTSTLESSGCSLIFGLGWTLFSLVFVFIGIGGLVSEYINYNRLLREGIETTAMIVDLKAEDSDGSTIYYVYYQFTGMVNNESEKIEDWDKVPYSLYSTFKVEQRIEIIYAASDSTLTTIKADFHPPNPLIPLIFSGMGILFTAIGVMVVYGGVRGQYHLSQLRSNGLQAQRLIFDLWQDKDSDGDTTYFVAYTFKVPERGGDGKIITKAEQNHIAHKKYHIGDAVLVRYLPDNPGVCQLR
jgi:hypothetical protein